MKADVDVAVVGAGVVGLATAAAFARRGRSVVLLERNDEIARETSSRNSEVVHAGLYYPEGTWKARTCAAGRAALYARCETWRIPHRRLGKIVVASTAEELPALERYFALGTANGAGAIELIDADAVRKLEPAVKASGALFSPETGIVDAHAYASSFLAEAERDGAVLVRRARVEGVAPDGASYRLDADCDGERQAIRAAAVVNAAGLAADHVAALAGIDVDAAGYRIHPCHGDYFALAPGHGLELSRLVYPVPAGPGLGVHATLDLGGRIRFGPDAYYGKGLDALTVDAGKAGAFAEVIARYLPGVEAADLTPDFVGIRPRLAAPGEPFRDFVVREESERGLPGFVNLLGIESPGLTAAAALAEEAVGLL